MSLKLYRPSRRGLEPAPVVRRDWRRKLRAQRWGAAPLENREARLTTPLQAVLFFGALAVVTFVIIVVGYGTGFWGA